MKRLMIIAIAALCAALAPAHDASAGGHGNIFQHFGFGHGAGYHACGARFDGCNPCATQYVCPTDSCASCGAAADCGGCGGGLLSKLFSHKSACGCAAPACGAPACDAGPVGCDAGGCDAGGCNFAASGPACGVAAAPCAAPAAPACSGCQPCCRKEGFLSGLFGKMFSNHSCGCQQSAVAYTFCDAAPAGCDGGACGLSEPGCGAPAAAPEPMEAPADTAPAEAKPMPPMPPKAPEAPKSAGSVIRPLPAAPSSRIVPLPNPGDAAGLDTSSRRSVVIGLRP